MNRLQPLRALKRAQEMPSGAKARPMLVVHVRAEARTFQKASSHTPSKARRCFLYLRAEARTIQGKKDVLQG
jgi:hypothetical protein